MAEKNDKEQKREQSLGFIADTLSNIIPGMGRVVKEKRTKKEKLDDAHKESSNGR